MSISTAQRVKSNVLRGTFTIPGLSQAAYSELARFYLPCLLPLALFGGIFINANIFKGRNKMLRAVPYGLLAGIVTIDLAVFYLDSVLRTLV